MVRWGVSGVGGGGGGGVGLRSPDSLIQGHTQLTTQIDENGEASSNISVTSACL